MITVHEAIQNNHGRYEWVSFTCPVHADSNPSARVNIYSGKWVCMSCGAKGLADDIHIEIDHQLRYVERLLAPVVDEELSESVLDRYDIDGPGDYWPSRFSAQACREFRLGHDEDYPTYPIRDEGGNLKGIVRRNPYGEKPKYKYPKGVSTSQYLFGYEKVDTDRIVLVEGAPDVIASWEVGVTAVGSYGSSLSDRQIALIARLQPSYVAVGYDNDRAGQIGLSEAVRGLLRAGIMAGPIVHHEYHDIAVMPEDVRRRVLVESLDARSTIDYLLAL